MARKVYGGRALLNMAGHHSTAAIVAEVENTKDRQPPASDTDGYDLGCVVVCKITDCDNSVNIEFEVSTANKLENTLYKVDTMIEALRQMRTGLIIEHHRMQDRLDEIPAERVRGFYAYKGARGKRTHLPRPRGT